MRKKTVNHVADTIFWYALYFLPVLITIVFNLGAMGSDTFWDFWMNDGDFTNIPNFAAFFNFFDSFGIGMYSPIYIALDSVFGPEGILPLFGTGLIFQYFTYFIGVYLMHLMVDFLLFIPRLCHKWMKSFTQGD